MVGKSLKKWWPVFVLPTLAAFIIGFYGLSSGVFIFHFVNLLQLKM